MSPMASDGPRWIRHRPDSGQRRASLAVAVGAGVVVGVAVGATVLYLTRLFMAREPLLPIEPTHGTGPGPREQPPEGAGA